MRLSSILIIAVTFIAAGLISLVTASFAVTMIEENSEYGVRQALDEKGLTWAEVHSNGLQVFLTGTAPSEANRFLAVSTAGSIVDAARVIDKMELAQAQRIKPPHFSLEILRNDSGISMMGLIPAATDREALLSDLADIVGADDVSDLLDVADYGVPEGWDAAVDFGISALDMLPRSKISIDADKVRIIAMADSAEAKRKVEADLTRAAPRGLRLGLEISAPRPVITPFSLRFIIDQNGARFDSCSADTEAARDRILQAALRAGLTGKAVCTIGLGVPSPNWSRAADMSIAALARLGGGSVTFADADITLVAAEGTGQGTFDQVVGELENKLPEVFTLHAVLPQKPAAGAQGTPEFVATMSPEGLVQMRGRISDELTRDAAMSFAQAKFGSEVVHMSARIDQDLPRDWPVRVLTALDALAQLSNGAVTVTPDDVTVMGNTGNPDANAVISRLLSDKLGEAEKFSIDVTYQEKLDPVASLPTPEECIAKIKDIQAARKISFEPGSDTIDGASRGTVDQIAEVLKTCPQIKLEIGGHTDSQGRETMNQSLSQARATAVLNGLRARRVLTSTFTAKGYGETQPIADNDTEEGREENRRIEFTLIVPKPIKETETTLEAVERDNGDTSATAASDAAASADEGTPDDTN